MSTLLDFRQYLGVTKSILIFCQILVIIALTACTKPENNQSSSYKDKINQNKEIFSSRLSGIKVYTKGKQVDYYEYQYDSQHRLVSITDNTQSPLAAYQYDNKGNISRKDQYIQTLKGKQSVSVFYEYDKNGMLNKQHFSSPELQSSRQLIRSDDHLVTNIVEQPLSGVTLDKKSTKIQYQSNHIKTAIKKDLRLDYQFENDLLTNVRVSNNSEKQELSNYQFQYQNQKIKQISESDRRVTYKYDSKDRLDRVEYFQNKKMQQTAHYMYDSMNRLLKIQSDTNADGQLDKTYVLEYNEAPCKAMIDPDKSLALFEVPKFPQPLDPVNICSNSSESQ